jgi:hypothetical protein
MVAAPVSAHSDRSAAVTEIDYGLRNRDTRTLVSENCLYEALCIYMCIPSYCARGRLLALQ